MLTKTDILAMDKPHELCKNIDKLNAHLPVLDTFSPEEKHQLSMKMAQHLSLTEIKQLINPLRGFISPQNFAGTLAKALIIANELLALDDPRNNNGRKRFLSENQPDENNHPLGGLIEILRSYSPESNSGKKVEVLADSEELLSAFKHKMDQFANFSTSEKISETSTTVHPNAFFANAPVHQTETAAEEQQEEADNRFMQRPGQRCTHQ